MNTEHERQTPSSVENRWFLLPELAAADVAGFLAKVQDRPVGELIDELNSEIDRLRQDAKDPTITEEKRNKILEQTSRLEQSLAIYTLNR